MAMIVIEATLGAGAVTAIVAMIGDAVVGGIRLHRRMTRKNP